MSQQLASQLSQLVKQHEELRTLFLSLAVTIVHRENDKATMADLRATVDPLFRHAISSGGLTELVGVLAAPEAVKPTANPKRITLKRICKKIRCLIGWHPWRTCMDNLQGQEERSPVTVCWKECPACAKSKLVFMFGNGHSRPTP